MPSTLTIMGMDVNGKLRIAEPGDVVRYPAGVVVGNTPSLTMTAALGSGSAASIVGTNKAGKITLTAGTLNLATGKILTLNFADSLTFPSGCSCLFSAGNDNFASVASQLYVVGNTTGVDLYVRGLALAAGFVYIGNYEITGY